MPNTTSREKMQDLAGIVKPLPLLLAMLAGCATQPNVRAINSAAPRIHTLVQSGNCEAARDLILKVGGPATMSGADALFERCDAQRKETAHHAVDKGIELERTP